MRPPLPARHPPAFSIAHLDDTTAARDAGDRLPGWRAHLHQLAVCGIAERPALGAHSEPWALAHELHPLALRNHVRLPQHVAPQRLAGAEAHCELLAHRMLRIDHDPG